MLFSNDELTLELLCVLKLKRGVETHNCIPNRYYESISFRTEGCGHFTAGGQEYDVGLNDLLYIPYSANYRQSSTGETVIAIHFFNYTRQKNATLEKISLTDYPQTQQLIEDMYQIWNEKKPGYKYKCTSMLYQLLYTVRLQVHNDLLQASNISPSLEAAVDYIHKHYRKDSICVKNLAKLSNISESQLRRQFQKAYGTSPLKYINHLRLEYAAQLLRSRLYTIEEVCEKAGFNDVKYFGRLFKQYYHETPGNYKNPQTQTGHN